MTKDKLSKPFEEIYEWLPIKYMYHLGLGGWSIEATDQQFYLGRPTDKFRARIISQGDK